MKDKGMSVEECVEKAQEYIKEQGMCLLLFDVKSSKTHPAEITHRLIAMMQDLNSRFDEYMPKNTLVLPGREETGFEALFGDGSWTGINSAEIIPQIIMFCVFSH